MNDMIIILNLMAEFRVSDFHSDLGATDCSGGEARCRRRCREAVRERAEGGAVRETPHQGTPLQDAAERRQSTCYT